MHDSEFIPSGLRAGGASQYSLGIRNIPALRDRGRWTAERTLERYIQEAAFHAALDCLPAACRATVAALESLAPAFFQPGHAPPEWGR